MRVECESCRELVAASFGVTGDQIRATCPACQHIMTAATVPMHARAPARSTMDLVAGNDRTLCPKCGAPRTTASACPTCGLATARMAAFSEAREANVSEAVRDAWRRATEAWSEGARHDELFRVVALHDSYAWAAGRYRTRKDDVSARQLDRLRRAAEATMLATATTRPDASTGPYRATRGVLIVLIVAIVVGLLYATLIRDRGAPASPALNAPVLTPVHPLVPGHPVSPSTIQK